MKHISITAFAAAFLMLVGCDETPRGGQSSLQSTLPEGQIEIIPSALPKVGRLYFSGIGKRPAFRLADGTRFNELCYGDFAQDTALADLSNHIVAERTGNTGQIVTQTLTGEASVSIPDIGPIEGIEANAERGRKRVFIVGPTSRLVLTEQGEQILRDNIGANCKSVIADLATDGRMVLLVLSATRADDLKDITRFVAAKGGLEGLKIADFEAGGRFENSELSQTTYANVLIGINPATLLQDGPAG